MKIANITASVFEFLAEEHINEMKFSGVLVLLDEPSTKAPNGSQGHKILIPKSVAEKKLHTLIGMGVNYSKSLDAHAPQKKVGVIQKAWLDGNKLMVSGVIWKKDFPEAIKDLKGKSDLGMSFEASDIAIENQNDVVWKIKDLCFTGATILYKNAAAYAKTRAIAANAVRQAAKHIKTIDGGKSMAHDKKKKVDEKKRVSKETPSTEQLLAENIKATSRLGKAVEQMCAAQENVIAKLANIKVNAEADDVEFEDDEEIEAAGASATAESEDIEAAKKDSESESESESSESEEMEADADDTSKLEKMGSQESDEPGHLNKKSKNKGRQTAVEGPAGGKSVSSSAFKKLAKTVEGLVASSDAKDETIKGLKKQLRKYKHQVEAAAERTERKSISASALTQNLLRKNNVDIDELQASGTKLQAEDVDTMMAGANLSIPQRIAMKTEMVRAGVLDEGFVNSTR